MSVTPRVAFAEEARLWTGYVGPAVSPTPIQGYLWRGQKVIKTVVIAQQKEGVMPRGSIIAADPVLGKSRLATDPADDLLGILVEDLVFCADESGNNIVDEVGAVAKTGCFRMDALIVGAIGNNAWASVGQFEAPLRLKGIFMEGESLAPTTGP